MTDALRELLGVERFREEEHSVVAFINAVQRFVEITGNENDFCLRAHFAQPICEMASAHLRHDDVGEQKIDMSS